MQKRSIVLNDKAKIEEVIAELDEIVDKFKLEIEERFDELRFKVEGPNDHASPWACAWGLTFLLLLIILLLFWPAHFLSSPALAIPFVQPRKAVVAENFALVSAPPPSKFLSLLSL